MQRDMLTALIAPGWAARRRRPGLAIALLLTGVVVPVIVASVALSAGRNRVALGLDSGFLALVMATVAVAVIARVAAVAEIWDAAGRPRHLDRPERIASIVVVLALVAGLVVVAQVGRGRAALDPVFADSDAAPLFDAAATDRASGEDVQATGGSGPPTTPPEGLDRTALGLTEMDDSGRQVPDAERATTTTTEPPPLPTRPNSGVSADRLADVWTVLLLGGDAGPGRQGLRTDTMMLFSLHRPSGRASLVSIPRDLRGLLFPPGSAMEARHPYGYDGIAGVVYPVVSADRSLRDRYAVDGVRPGVVAIAQAIGYSLDVTIHDYALIDMQGFVGLVDAVGGVTVDVRKEIPMPGNLPGAATQYPDTIGPGIVEMDGTTALGYVRSRYADSDFGRTARQRRLLASLARQVSITELVWSFPSVASAAGGTLRTSMSPEELVETLNVIGGETAIVESLGLVPPLIDINRPDFDAAARAVGAVRLALVDG